MKICIIYGYLQTPVIQEKLKNENFSNCPKPTRNSNNHDFLGFTVEKIIIIQKFENPCKKKGLVWKDSKDIKLKPTTLFERLVSNSHRSYKIIKKWKFFELSKTRSKMPIIMNVWLSLLQKSHHSKISDPL